MDFNVTLKSKKVTLRSLRTDDYDELLHVVSDSDLWAYFTHDLSIPNELKRWIGSAVIACEKLTRIPFAIIDNETGHAIGSTSFGSISLRDERVEIGWTFLGKDYHGKGFNQEAKRLMLEYAFDVNKLQRVECKTDVLNSAARKALEKIGFTEEGVLRSHTLMADGRRRDTIYYSILSSEWQEIQKTLQGNL